MTRLIDVDTLLNETVKKNSVWNSMTNASGETLEQIVNRLHSEPCEDAISRKALKEAIRDGVRNKKNESLFDTIDNMPSVIPTRNRAKWIMTGEKVELYCEIARCSSCGGETINSGVDKFCPDCGAEMERALRNSYRPPN